MPVVSGSSSLWHPCIGICPWKLLCGVGVCLSWTPGPPSWAWWLGVRTEVQNIPAVVYGTSEASGAACSSFC